MGSAVAVAVGRGTAGGIETATCGEGSAEGAALATLSGDKVIVGGNGTKAAEALDAIAGMAVSFAAGVAVAADGSGTTFRAAPWVRKTMRPVTAAASAMAAIVTLAFLRAPPLTERASRVTPTSVGGGRVETPSALAYVCAVASLCFASVSGSSRLTE